MKNKWIEVFNKSNKRNLSIIKNILDSFCVKDKFKVIDVVGTNGKGSVSNYIYQGLVEKGYKVGLFTSPHINIPNERIIVNGDQISDYDFFKIYNDLPKNLYFFAYMFLVAIKHFINKGCDYVILEAGIGGSRDTINALDGDYGLVTSIGLDHVDLLGDTTEKIAEDKAGIINNGMNFIVPSFIKEKNAFLKYKNATEVTIKGNNYKERNEKLASIALKKWFNIDKNQFKPIKGRTQIFEHNGLKTIFDVAHNYDGIVESLKLIPQDIEQVVISFKNNKDTTKILDLFKNKDLFYYRPNKNFKNFNSLKEINDINFFYKNQTKSTLYIGSFYLIGDIND